VDPFLFSLAAAGGAGSLLGFCARAIFHGRTPWLRWTTALSALVFCLFLMGGFTRGFVGVSPVALPRPQPDWSAVALIGAGGVLAALSLAARKPRVLADASPAPIEEEASAARHANVRLVPGRADAPTKIRVPVLERIRVGIRGWKRRARKDEVRFVGAEEHRCPYCLQPIVNRDPRGVVTCPECHTRHHKDCWDITGMCQIPHYHS
jgi:ribosomal protein L37AE/L43A